MIIRIILITLFIGFIFRLFSNSSVSRAKAWKKIGVVGLFFFAIFSIYNPEFSNQLAHHVGIGRGADLLLYFLTVAFIGSTINQYMKNKDSEQRIAILAREIAIINADKKK